MKNHTVGVGLIQSVFLVGLLISATAVAKTESNRSNECVNPPSNNSVQRHNGPTCMPSNKNAAKTKGWTTKARPLPPGAPHYVDPYGYVLPFNQYNYVKFAGSARIATLWDQNRDFATSPGNFYLQERIQTNADFHLLNGDLRFYVELGGTKSQLQNRPLAPVDQSGWEVNQVFVEVPVPSWRGGGYLRVGRQQLDVDRDMWTTVRLGSNVQSFYDGIHLYSKLNSRSSVDAFIVRPLANEAGSFNDSSNGQARFYGVYLKNRWTSSMSQDFFVLGWNGTIAPPIGPIPGPPKDQSRVGLGTRLYGDLDNFYYNADLMYQTGTEGSKNIRAWGTMNRFGYTFADATGKPRVGVLLGAGSGSSKRSDGDLGTFYPYEMGYGYQFGPGNYTSIANRFVFGPELELNPSPKVRLQFNLYGNRRLEAADCVYVVPTKKVAATCGKPGGDYLGTTIAASLRYRFTKHILADFWYTRFETSGVLKAVGGRDSQYFATRLYFMF